MTGTDMALVAQLEQALLAVWPAIDTIHHDGWAIRAAGGFSGRANSASALRPDRPIDHEHVEMVSCFFAERNLPARYRTSPLCKPGTTEFLKSNGFTSRGIAHTMVATLADAFQADPRVVLENSASPPWLAHVTSRQADPAKRNPTALAAITSRITVPACFATLTHDGTPAGFGLAAIDGDWLELSSIIIDEHHRGLGLGRALVTSLLAWGQHHGAAHAFLQVDADNQRALNLYGSLGFAKLYEYDTLVRNTA